MKPKAEKRIVSISKIIDMEANKSKKKKNDFK